jgi:hypothetical protein
MLWFESPKERDHSEDQGIDGRMGLEYLREIGLGGVDWSRLAQDRDRWQAVMIAVMYVPVLVPQT